DKRFERASTKLVEVEKAIRAREGSQGTDKLRAVQAPKTLKPVDVAAKVIAVLTPYVSIGEQDFARNAGSAAYEKARNMLSILKEKWSEDKEAIENLARFTEKPERYKPVLEDILQEKLAGDKDLVSRLSHLL